MKGYPDIHGLLASNEKAREIWEREKTKYVLEIKEHELMPGCVAVLRTYTWKRFLFFNYKSTICSGRWDFNPVVENPHKTELQYNKFTQEEWLKEYVLKRAGFRFKSNHMMFYTPSNY